MKILKKNQVIILITTIMLVAIGYLNYNQEEGDLSVATSSNANFGDAALVSSTSVDVLNEEVPESNIVEEKEAVTQTTTTKVVEQDNYFANSKNERDTMYSQNLETYQKMLDNTNLATEQKLIATEEIKKINDKKNGIMIVENLIKTKGFEDVVVLINGDSVNVIVKIEKLETESMAQIQNIITRELKTDIENIHIMNR